MGEGLLKEAEMIHCITKVHPSTSDSSQSWEPGVHCTACRQLHRLDKILSRWCLSWSDSLSSSSVAFCFLQAAGLASESLQLLLLTLIQRSLNLVIFRDFLKLFQVIYVPALS